MVLRLLERFSESSLEYFGFDLFLFGALFEEGFTALSFFPEEL